MMYVSGKQGTSYHGTPLRLLDYSLFIQLEEPLLLLGKDRFSAVDIRVRVNGGGHIAQVYGKRL